MLTRRGFPRHTELLGLHFRLPPRNFKFQESKAMKNVWILIPKALLKAFSCFWIALDNKFLRRRSNIASLVAQHRLPFYSTLCMLFEKLIQTGLCLNAVGG